MKNNPMADQKSYRDLKEKLAWYDMNSMSEEERKAINEIFK